MDTNLKNYYSLAVLLPVVFMVACAAGPTKRYVDGKWSVSENICSSDPEQPDLGDMRSEIRQYESYQTSYERKITIYHLDKTILNVSQMFNRSGSKGEIKYYENSSANPVLETKRIPNTRELNNAIEQGIEQFFANDSSIDGSKAKSFCLYRGQ